MDGAPVQEALPGKADAGVAIADMGGGTRAVHRPGGVCRWGWSGDCKGFRREPGEVRAYYLTISGLLRQLQGVFVTVRASPDLPICRRFVLIRPSEVTL